MELRAPQHNVKVICDWLEVAIHLRCRRLSQLLANLLHAIRHHAIGNEVLAHILGPQFPLLQP